MIQLESLKKLHSVKDYVLEGELTTLEVSVDNRILSNKSLFIAIVGNRFNPLEHLDKVVSQGCKYVAYESSTENDEKIKSYSDKINFIKVHNIINFIEDLGATVACEFRERGGKIIGISGSNGKTTTKEMLNFLLGKTMGEDKVICTQKNNNNNLGVPFTLFQINSNTEYAIVELGSNHPGEIEVLCRILRPQFGVTTNIGDTHLEFFGSRQKVFEEESVLAKYCSEVFFKNSDDQYLKEIAGNCLSFGLNGADYKLKFGDDHVNINEVVVHNKWITGKHNYFNLAVAFMIANYILPDEQNSIIANAKKFKPTANRSEWIEWKEKKVFLDAYNANPSSMQVAYDGFVDRVKKLGAGLSECTIVMGDMNELGEQSDILHRAIGKHLAQNGATNCIFVGRYAHHYQAGYGEGAKIYKTVNELKLEFLNVIKGTKYIFLKGSRSLQLESVLDIS